MKWFEMIRVRSSAEALVEIIPSLRTKINQINGSEKQVEALLLQHALYRGDLSLLVAWNNEQIPAKTKQGLMFADQLQLIGPVDHAVWIPVKENVFHESG